MSSGLLDFRMQCKEHECPMLRIGDGYYCLFEYVDAHLGRKTVTDVVPGSEGKPAVLVFADGHTLPMLCPDCMGPLHVRNEQDAGALLEGLAGKTLIRLGYGESSEEKGELVLGFYDDPDADADEEPDLELSIRPESIKGLNCPDESRSPTHRKRRR